jgi:LysR family transcriptional activator of nhaA
MEWLNYHHLLYFWTVVQEGSVSKAAERLRLSQPTVSAQLRQLEAALGDPLFERQGRRLVLTEVGRVAYGYADEIFSIGREFMDTLRGRPTSHRPAKLRVGVANALSKLVVYRLLRPVLDAGPVHLVCHEGAPDKLVADLASHALDVVLCDVEAPPHVRVRVFNHQLGDSGLSFFAAGALGTRLARRFPESLSGAPLLLPTADAAVRRPLDHWLQARGLRPNVLAEFEDSALMQAFGEAGDGAFVAPTTIEAEVCRHYRVKVIGRLPDVRERYYAVSIERKIRHAAVKALTSSAREALATKR